MRGVPRLVFTCSLSTKAPLFILALLPNGVEAFASFSEVGLPGCFFQREFFDHRLQFRLLGITYGFGQFGCSLADLVFQLVDTTNQALGAASASSNCPRAWARSTCIVLSWAWAPSSAVVFCWRDSVASLARFAQHLSSSRALIWLSKTALPLLVHRWSVRPSPIFVVGRHPLR